MNLELNKFWNCNCMDFMKIVPDKFFELAMVDPPFPKNFIRRNSSDLFGILCKDNWLDLVPDKKYFDELFRISQNQIIWGGNYFTNWLTPSSGWIIWNKLLPEKMNFAPCELAWTSFYIMKKFDMSTSETRRKEFIYWHTCPRPINLYRLCLQNYAKPGDKIFDSHVGSGSSLIACIEEKFDYIGCEIDIDYYREANKRIEIYKSQGKLF